MAWPPPPGKDAGAEVTIAGRSQEKLIRAQRALGQVHTVVMDITDQGAVEKGCAGFSPIDRGLISAGAIRHGSMDTVTTLRHER